jgi:FtsP/CotA-like multicopper oxidase with cupredoxin domain
MTRQNVYAGPAGFWLIRDKNGQEKNLNLPGPSPKVGDSQGNNPFGKYYEIPLVIQDRSFNKDGSLFYPKHRAFFEGISDKELKIKFAPKSDIAKLWNPEAFFNVMVVNGVSWPFLDVDQARYRFRILNGTNSRFLNLALFVVKSDGSLGEEIPMWGIGSDQGLLSDVVKVKTGNAVVFDDETGIQHSKLTDPSQAMLVAPSERSDIIVEFNNLAPGTRVRMINTAPDAPFGGFPDIPADPDTTGQVMEFVVGPNIGPNFADPTKLSLADKSPLVASNVRELSLNEEESSEVCVVIKPNGAIQQLKKVQPGPTFVSDCLAVGGTPFAPQAALLGTVSPLGISTSLLWSDPITENPGISTTEEWVISNLTVDAHPIHIHLGGFQVVGRELIGGGQSPIGLLPFENGFKDTVIAFPGEITRIRKHFDNPGLYVWHCHILEHEDNEMMRPDCVGVSGQDCPAQLF